MIRDNSPKTYRQITHLAKRFVLSLAPSQIADFEQHWVSSQLTTLEFELWAKMLAQDQRHSILVSRRFVALHATAQRSEIAGALLHDVGKSASQLGTFLRVIATLLGPRTNRFRVYHDHEIIGGQMLRAINSDALTVALVEGTCELRLRQLLRGADNI